MKTVVIFYCALFCSEEGGGEPVAKKAKVDDSLDGGMKDIAKAKVTEVIYSHTHIYDMELNKLKIASSFLRKI